MAAEERSGEIEAFEKQVGTWKIPEDDELLKCLQKKLRSDLKGYVAFFQQCKSMERLKSLQELEEKISSLLETCFFYIGHTQNIDSLRLWNAHPESKKWEKQGGQGKGLVKTYTYFTHLNERDKQTKDDLVKEWNGDEKCLNDKDYGNKTKTGIVYLLVYEPVDPREDVKRLCQELNAGDVKDPAFREKIKKVKEVLGI